MQKYWLKYSTKITFSFSISITCNVVNIQDWEHHQLTILSSEKLLRTIKPPRIITNSYQKPSYNFEIDVILTDVYYNYFTSSDGRYNAAEVSYQLSKTSYRIEVASEFIVPPPSRSPRRHNNTDH